MSEESKFYIKAHPRLENAVELIIVVDSTETDSYVFTGDSPEEAKEKAIEFLKSQKEHV